MRIKDLSDYAECTFRPADFEQIAIVSGNIKEISRDMSLQVHSDESDMGAYEFALGTISDTKFSQFPFCFRHYKHSPSNTFSIYVNIYWNLDNKYCFTSKRKNILLYLSSVLIYVVTSGDRERIVWSTDTIFPRRRMVKVLKYFMKKKPEVSFSV